MGDPCLRCQQLEARVRELREEVHSLRNQLHVARGELWLAQHPVVWPDEPRNNDREDDAA